MHFKGHAMELPLWVVILDAAEGDPLRAQEMEERLSREWWERWMIYTREKARAAESHGKKSN